MFSLENLAWRTSSRDGFTYDDLPESERGPNGGRIMWFPPYNIKFSETVSPTFNPISFLGRPEPIYTYGQTTRTGQLSWSIIVDHPSILNLIVKKQLNGENKQKIYFGSPNSSQYLIILSQRYIIEYPGYDILLTLYSVVFCKILGHTPFSGSPNPNDIEHPAVNISVLFLINSFNPTNIPSSRHSPSIHIVLFSGILLSLVGVEVAAYHIREAKEPQKDYPRALAIASLFILVISILGTLSIAIVVPQKDISLLSGLIQAFRVFFQAFNLSWLIPLLALLALVGSLASVNTWIVGPAKGLLITAQDGYLPPFLTQINAKGVPVGMLLFQAVVGTVLSFVFLWMDSHSAAYWILTALSAQFAVVEYGFVFAASSTSRTGISSACEICANSLTKAILTCLKVFSNNLAASAISGLGTIWIMSQNVE